MAQPVDFPPAADPRDRGASLADIQGKHDRIARFLCERGYDALVLTRPENVSWFTGRDCGSFAAMESAMALFITPEARVVLTDNVESPRIFESVLGQSGFQLKERQWQDARGDLQRDVCRARKVCCDAPFEGAEDVSTEIDSFRLPLTEFECRRLRRLGRLVAHAVEATARSCTAGRSEAEIAGEVAHRLVKREVTPVRIQVAGDGRLARCRSWTYGANSVERFCTISAVGRRDGLALGVSRTICFDEIPRDLLMDYQRTALVHATVLYFSRPEWSLAEVWRRLRRIYEKFRAGNEWRLAAQGEVTGYRLCEHPVLPESSLRLVPGMPVFWHPSVGAAMAGDSILSTAKGPELLTPTEHWPRYTIAVKGTAVHCPEILCKPALDDSPEPEWLTQADDSILQFSLDDSFAG